jgi:molybdopterin-synthase adenylyltransferase
VRNEIRFLADDWTVLREHLLSDGDEHAAILVCGTVVAPEGVRLLVREVVCLTDDDLLDSSGLHLSVDPVSMARVAKRAHRLAASVVVCHSHPFPGTVRPSTLDLETEAILCGRALPARLAQRPVGALIVGPDGISARLYTSGDVQPALVRVLAESVESIPTSDAEDAALTERHDRQLRAWGLTGQLQLARTRVVVIGVGGTGSHVAVQLAHLGVSDLTLVDPDTVEESNLSRIIGSTADDVGRHKVDVIADVVARINPLARVERLCSNVLDIDPAAAPTVTGHAPFSPKWGSNIACLSSTSASS